MWLRDRQSGNKVDKKTAIECYQIPKFTHRKRLRNESVQDSSLASGPQE